MRALLIATTVLGAVTLTQCGTGMQVQADYPLQTGDEVALVYQDSGTTLALCNAAGTPRVQRAGARGASIIKTASDQNIQVLLSRFEDLGYFSSASESARPNAKASLALVINGRRYVHSRMPLAASSVNDIERFNSYARAFRTVYDHTQAFQAATVKAGDFYRENERLINNAREAKARGASSWGRK